jgi:pSer/pThr/pTyr-binding forkhead associated (FHA) protein
MRSNAVVAAVDIDRPADAPPALPDAPPSGGVPTPPKPLDEIEVPPGVLGLLILDGGSRQFPILTEAAVIGRYDPVTGTRPEIDLTQVDIHRSVSRRHARILVEGGTFSLAEEVGALNGTSVNSQRLTTGQPKAIVNGDRLGLGMVSLVFKAGGIRAAGKKAPAKTSTSRRD